MVLRTSFISLFLWRNLDLEFVCIKYDYYVKQLWGAWPSAECSLILLHRLLQFQGLDYTKPGLVWTEEPHDSSVISFSDRRQKIQYESGRPDFSSLDHSREVKLQVKLKNTEPEVDLALIWVHICAHLDPTSLEENAKSLSWSNLRIYHHIYQCLN